MLIINFNILRAIINMGDNLKDKQANKKKSGIFWLKIYPMNFSLQPIYLCAKRISILSPLVFAQLIFKLTQKS